MMNLCFMTDGFTGGGVPRAVSVVGNALQRENVCQCFALCYTSKGEEDIYSVSFPYEYAYTEPLTMKTAFLSHHYIHKAVNYLRRNKIDIVIGCGAMFFPIAVISARICGIQVICWEHTNPRIVNEYSFQRESRFFGADRNIVLTNSALELYDKWFFMKENVQIYNPVDASIQVNFRQYCGKSRKIMSAGRLSYPKNYSRLLDIAYRIKKDYPDWHWDIYGEGEERAALEEKISRLGLNDFITLKGNVSDLYQRFPEYAFFVMTSRYEGFPMVLLEAAANGLPMVAFDVMSGPNEIIRSGENGYLCSSDSDAEMVDSLRRLMRSEDLRTAMSKESRKTIAAFSEQNVLVQWSKLLQEMQCIRKRKLRKYN